MKTINLLFKYGFGLIVMIIVYGMSTCFAGAYCLWDWEQGKKEFKDFQFCTDLKEFVEDSNG